jgi:cytochrome c oxidase subunit 6a
MSSITRNALRTVARSIPRARNLTTAHPGTTKYSSEHAALQAHASETTDLWRKISFYVCFPAIAVCVAWVYNVEEEHAAHTEHIKAENDGNLPDIPDYEYMNRRVKPFPWGMNTLFYNAHVNKDLSESE